MGLTLEREAVTETVWTLLPPRKRWTEEEYDRLADAGFLCGNYELIEGEILEFMPTNPPHVLAIMLFTSWLVSVFGLMRVRQEKPIRLPGKATKPQPDLSITAEEAQAYGRRHPDPADLLLVVEVSDSTLDYDRTKKALLYAQAGIVEYWLLDLEGRRLLVHRQSGPEGYADVQEFSETAQASLLSRPDAVCDVAALLPPTKPATGKKRIGN